MGSLLDFVPTGYFAIRVHGKRWLQITKAHKGPTIALGWRAISWTPALDEAEKWASRATAERFASMLLCPCEIVDVERRSGLTPDFA